MRTYQLEKQPGLPLYESLYRCIRDDILAGKLAPGEKLPSKRALAQHLEISKITVEGAYSQLLSEGYVRSQEKVGYFVEAVQRATPAPSVECSGPLSPAALEEQPRFPFSVWSRLQRQVLLDYGPALLSPMPNLGIWELRQAICRHLADFRGMAVSPDRLLLGAGTDFLYNLLIQLLGRELCYGVEEPGYHKIRKIYRAGGVEVLGIPMDDAGVRPDALGNARVLHITPNHHYPTGLITPVPRRQELLAWARERNAWIIEDDYDTEFRFDARPMPALQSMDPNRVIYMNSFSKTLAPSIRISYMVLPGELMERFQRELGFYSCTVPSFEQHTLARFLAGGHFEKHINRMRKYYRSRRNRLIALVKASQAAGRLTVLEQNAGLHFLLKVDTALSDEELTRLLSRRGLDIPTLGSFYHLPLAAATHSLVVNYTTLSDTQLEELLETLKELP